MINPFNKPKNSLTNFGSSSEDISKDLAGISSQLESLGATNPNANNVAPVGSTLKSSIINSAVLVGCKKI